jgi:hypothetical protein
MIWQELSCTRIIRLLVLIGICCKFPDKMVESLGRQMSQVADMEMTEMTVTVLALMVEGLQAMKVRELLGTLVGG